MLRLNGNNHPCCQIRIAGDAEFFVIDRFSPWIIAKTTQLGLLSTAHGCLQAWLILIAQSRTSQMEMQ